MYHFDYMGFACATRSTEEEVIWRNSFSCLECCHSFFTPLMIDQDSVISRPSNIVFLSTVLFLLLLCTFYLMLCSLCLYGDVHVPDLEVLPLHQILSVTVCPSISASWFCCCVLGTSEPQRCSRAPCCCRCFAASSVLSSWWLNCLACSSIYSWLAL